MRFSIFHNFDALGRWHEYDAVMREVVEVARLADDAGFWSIWYPEQHLRPEGMEACPNPILQSAWTAAHTSRIRIGQAANIITQWHPLRLAEDIAVLDHMTRGRIEVGLGRGFAHEAINFNPFADTRDQEQNRALFEETLEVLLAAWSGEAFAHTGRFYEFPVPGVELESPGLASPVEIVDDDGVMTRLALRPQPYQRPHPPLWQVVDSPRSIEYAASRGINALMWLPPVSVLRDRFELYRAAAAAAGRPAGPGEGIALLRDCYVAETMEQARSECEASLMTSYEWILGKRGVQNLLEAGEDPAGASLTFDFVFPRNLLVGTPEYVIEKIHELRETLELEHLFIWSSHAGMPHDRLMKSLALFAEHVLPEFADGRLAAPAARS